MTKDQVKQAQMMLNALGFNSGTADGIIGPITRAAVTAFQKAVKLPENGVLDANVFQKLAEAHRAKMEKGKELVVPSAGSSVPMFKKTLNKNVIYLAVGLLGLGLIIPLMMRRK